MNMKRKEMFLYFLFYSLEAIVGLTKVLAFDLVFIIIKRFLGRPVSIIEVKIVCCIIVAYIAAHALFNVAKHIKDNYEKRKAEDENEYKKQKEESEQFRKNILTQ